MSGHVLPGSTENHSTHDGLAQAQVRRYRPLRFARIGAASYGSDKQLRGLSAPDSLASRGALGLSVLSVTQPPRAAFWGLARPMPIAALSTFGMEARAVPISTARYLTAFSVPVMIIVPLRPHPKMGGVHARGVVAPMQNIRSFSGDCPIRQNPRESVRSDLSAVADESIPSSVPCPRPQPAGTKLDHMSKDRPVAINLTPKIIWCILPHSSVEPPCPRFRGQGRSGVTSTLAVRSFYHRSAENPNKTAGKAA